MTAPSRSPLAALALAALCLTLFAGDVAARGHGGGSTYGRSYAPRTPSYTPRVRSYTPRTPGYSQSPYPRSYTRKAPGYVSPTPSHTPRLPGYSPGAPNSRRYIVPNPD